MEEEGYSNGAAAATTSNKKRKISPSTETDTNTDALIDSKFALFDELPDDLVVNIVSKLGATASCPADFFNLRLTCKRLNELGLDPTVLSKLSANVFACRAKNLRPEPLQFMDKCVQAMNTEAIFTLGMIRFYILKEYEVGQNLISYAARKRHPLANYTMFIIHFNGSGGGERNMKAAMTYLLRAAMLGHVNAIRELGYRVEEIASHNSRNDPEEGRRLHLQATAREIVSMLPPDAVDKASDERGRISIPAPKSPCLQKVQWLTSVPRGPGLSSFVSESELAITSDFGWNIPEPIAHPVHRLLIEWFETRGGDPGNGLRLCSRVMCGRPETRNDEFFGCPRCPLQRVPCYCSRDCLNADWKKRHHLECSGNDFNYAISDGDDDDEENDEDIEEENDIQAQEDVSEGDLEN